MEEGAAVLPEKQAEVEDVASQVEASAVVVGIVQTGARRRMEAGAGETDPEGRPNGEEASFEKLAALENFGLASVAAVVAFRVAEAGAIGASLPSGVEEEVEYLKEENRQTVEEGLVVAADGGDVPSEARVLMAVAEVERPFHGGGASFHGADGADGAEPDDQPCFDSALVKPGSEVAHRRIIDEACLLGSTDSELRVNARLHFRDAHPSRLV